MKSVLLIIIVLSMISCYNQRPDTIEKEQLQIDSINSLPVKNDIVLSMSIEAHLKNNFYALRCDTLFFVNEMTDKKEISMRKDTILYGYSEAIVEQFDVELYFDEQRAKEIDVESGWYLCDYVTISMHVDMPKDNKIFVAPSENCGFMPGGSGRRGYAMALVDKQQVLYTYVYHIKSNKNRIVNVLYPKFAGGNSLNNIKWNVKYINAEINAV